MTPIKMVDLKGQYEKIKKEIDENILQVIESTIFINGPKVKEFQTHLENYLGVKHVIPCANGTDALQVSLMALGLKAGDEVITSPFTFIATAEVVGLLGITCKFADVERDTFNLDVTQLEKAITPKTKAIIPVHLFGQSCNMEIIMQIAKKYGLFVIEDACQSIGADFIYKNGEKKKTGTIGDIGCTSFFPSKNLGCYGDGGAIFTNDDELARKLRGICNHGMFEQYHHKLLGVNSRLDAIQAAVLDVKLKYLDEYNATRRKAADFYNKMFENNPNIEIPAISSFSTHVFHQYTLKLKNANREKVIEKMKEAEIPVMVYYPVPLHLQEAFGYLGYNTGDFPITEKLSECVISLPMHTELTEEQQMFIGRNLIGGLGLS
ncbi:MAG: DegT/DnrJ/EryC1/StrS family aminotransferase [Bacteroidetes bacterium]|nr:DegT/DnrJ/EryC1/StrS family aminotransferase [Bacteroidota bacterium]MCL1968180.1 DegT/DnrJ/EryC1/StrS family aminotransferase [Bacteroidota bacterium]MCL1968547.1 DegT/DnrJ/EryC1/StrS family aminotransferase [Bacteroidota bacterium]